MKPAKVFYTQQEVCYQMSDYRRQEKRYLRDRIAVLGALALIAIGFFIVGTFDAQSVATAIQMGGK